jgi:hypothetical protein
VNTRRSGGQKLEAHQSHPSDAVILMMHGTAGCPYLIAALDNVVLLYFSQILMTKNLVSIAWMQTNIFIGIWCDLQWLDSSQVFYLFSWGK